MTDRELRLRLRIDTLTDERDTALEQVDALSAELEKTRDRLSSSNRLRWNGMQTTRYWKRKYDQLANRSSKTVPVLILSSRYPRVKK